MHRTGIGYDAHRFSGPGPLRLGGIDVPYHTGLAGHSDADVLLHAICDALLGAAALPDIGRQFPPDDPYYKDISSRVLLARVCNMVSEAGYGVGNVDAVVIAQEPRLAGYMDEMRETIARTMNIETSCVGLKATTTEGMDDIGRARGIAAQAVATLYKNGQDSE